VIGGTPGRGLGPGRLSSFIPQEPSPPRSEPDFQNEIDAQIDALASRGGQVEKGEGVQDILHYHKDRFRVHAAKRLLGSCFGERLWAGTTLALEEGFSQPEWLCQEGGSFKTWSAKR
jgi:hypothetical protein